MENYSEKQSLEIYNYLKSQSKHLDFNGNLTPKTIVKTYNFIPLVQHTTGFIPLNNYYTWGILGCCLAFLFGCGIWTGFNLLNF